VEHFSWHWCVINNYLKLEKILNRIENGGKQFTRFDSKHMTLIIDNKKWPCKRIYKELRTNSKIESYRNKKDGNIPCWFGASPILYGVLNNFWRWHERDSTAQLWHSERGSTAPLITYQYHIVNRWCHHLNPASVSHLNSLIIEGMRTSTSLQLV
jgi:hypothetical protein